MVVPVKRRGERTRSHNRARVWLSFLRCRAGFQTDSTSRIRTASPWAALNAAIRDGLKRTGRITGEERKFVALKPMNLTEAERSDFAHYQPGQVIQFVQNARGWKRGERAEVIGADKAAVFVERKDGRREALALTQAARFQLYKPETLELAQGDKLRITRNGFTQETRRGGKAAKSRLNNGDVYEVAAYPAAARCAKKA